VRVTLNVEALKQDHKQLEAGASYDLAKYGDITGRQPDGTEIFRFTEGALDLKSFKAEQDAETKGSFNAKFRAGDDVVSLNGNFSAELEIVAEANWP
jgi:hypothetical protein